MDKLRKYGQAVWLNKERAILAIAVIALGVRVFMVMNPSEEKFATGVHPTPKRDIPAEVREGIVKMPQPPTLPAFDIEQWRSLTVRNPFWYFSGQGIADSNGPSEEVEDIAVLRITMVKGEPRAQLRTANASKWYKENDKAETFEVLRINPEQGTCEVRSFRLGRVLTLALPAS